MPKHAVWRSFVISHLIHHRAQLVYLRLLDVPVPSSAVRAPTRAALTGTLASQHAFHQSGEAGGDVSGGGILRLARDG